MPRQREYIRINIDVLKAYGASTAIILGYLSDCIEYNIKVSQIIEKTGLSRSAVYSGVEALVNNGIINNNKVAILRR